MHLSIIANEQHLFSEGDTEVHMKRGELWEINNRREYGVGFTLTDITFTGFSDRFYQIPSLRHRSLRSSVQDS